MLTCWSGQTRRLCDGQTRRDFLTAGMLGAAGLTLGDVLGLRGSTAARPKSVIMILLPGGPSHIDMYDLKPDAPAEVRGEFKPIRTNVPGFDISELMPEQAKIADKLALVRNLQMRTSSHNLEEVTTGFLFNRIIPGASGSPRPAFGSVVSRLRGPQTMPPFVNLWSKPEEAEKPAYVGSAHKPFTPSGSELANMKLPADVSQDRLGDRKQLLATFDALRRDLDNRGDVAGMDAATQRALEIVTSNRVRDAFDVLKESADVRARYGLTANLPAYNANYGVWKQFLLARRLVEAGVSVVSMSAFGQWDTHADNFASLRRMVPVLDKGIAALVSDLHERGLDKDVAVVLWGEFGRTPKISTLPGGKSPGRDHYGPANFALFAGGGFKTGQVIGATDSWAARPRGSVYRAEHVMATLYHTLGIDPGTTLLDQQGRPMYLLDEREPIAELF